MSEKTYKYKVKMNCSGCSGAIERVLAKAQSEGAGVHWYSVSLKEQSVLVKGVIDFEDLTKRIEKTGKEIVEKDVVDATSSAIAPAAESVAVA